MILLATCHTYCGPMCGPGAKQCVRRRERNRCLAATRARTKKRLKFGLVAACLVTGEGWGAPGRMGDELNANTEESCTQYNILKVARHLFEWTANSTYFDFFEHAVLNGIIGNQERVDEAMTSFIYM